MRFVSMVDAGFRFAWQLLFWFALLLAASRHHARAQSACPDGRCPSPEGLNLDLRYSPRFASPSPQPYYGAAVREIREVWCPCMQIQSSATYYTPQYQSPLLQSYSSYYNTPQPQYYAPAPARDTRFRVRYSYRGVR